MFFIFGCMENYQSYDSLIRGQCLPAISVHIGTPQRVEGPASEETTGVDRISRDKNVSVNKDHFCQRMQTSQISKRR
jgi:hypothetical protein